MKKKETYEGVGNVCFFLENVKVLFFINNMYFVIFACEDEKVST
jgi:hypothetical protein